ncbi:MAG: helix-turn-helix domain-containing protein [Candidatus Aminicenantes bacterium]|nr:helix-turn-helix domain-containing protein [Candidatus Aminicenantes bacterium]
MVQKYRQSRFSIDMEETGKRLKEFRTSLHITIAELSQETGLSLGMISETESGKNKPSPNLMLALHELYGLNINWLLTGEGPMVVWGKVTGPPKDAKGEPTLDMDMLIWYAERLPIVRYSILSFFIDFFYRNKQMLEDLLKEMKESGHPD